MHLFLAGKKFHIPVFTLQQLIKLKISDIFFNKRVIYISIN